jgi:uncharacterized protein (DUF1501 family)
MAKLDRRHFLKNSLLSLGSLPLVGSPFSVLPGRSQLEAALKTSDKANDHVLVLIQLVGGNDGLNMILPMETYGHLWASRLSVVVPSQHILNSKQYPRVAFHPAMEGVKNLFDNNQVSVINSVGYPNQNFSHFRSMDIWMTGANANENLSTGWMGRYLDQTFKGFPNIDNLDYTNPPALVTDAASPVLLQSEFNLGISISNPKIDYQLSNKAVSFKLSKKAQEERDFLMVSGQLSNGYSKQIYEKANLVGVQKEYPNTNLGRQLKNISLMIASGLKTKVYLATLTGFDTHANQVERDTQWKGHHANLLSELSTGITAFMADLKHLGTAKRVVGLTFSEFGRRVGANGGLGTDHGAAAPMLAFGEQVLGGLAGDNPTIDPNHTQYTSLPMLYDFRSVFSSVLKDWFCVNQNVLEQVFLKNYQYIPIVANYDCLGVTGNETNQGNVIENNKPVTDNNIVKITSTEKTLQEGTVLKSYPNPFTDYLHVEFESTGGNCNLQIYSALGQKISTIKEGNLLAGFYKIKVATNHLADGLYYLRYQNKGLSKIVNILKRS